MKRMKLWGQRRPQVVIGGACGFLLSAVFLVSAPTDRDGASSEMRALTVRTLVPAISAGYEVTRESVGRVEANRESHVGFELAGRVRTVRVDDGESIARGQALAVLDTELLEATRAEVTSTVGQARAALDLAQSTVLRHRDAARRNAISTQALDEAEQSLAVRRAALQEAEAALHSIDVRIEKSTLRAPYDAVVAARIVDEGQVVAAGSPLFHLLERANPTARIALPGTSANILAVGDSTEVRIGDRSVRGTLKAVLPVRGRSTRSVEILIRLEAELNGLRQGDLVTLSVSEFVPSAGFWLPLEALTASSRGLWSVYVVDTSVAETPTAQRRELEVLHHEAGRVFVRGTLAPGEQVVIDGNHRLVPGQEVEVSTSTSTHGAER